MALDRLERKRVSIDIHFSKVYGVELAEIRLFRARGTPCTRIGFITGRLWNVHDTASVTIGFFAMTAGICHNI